MAENESLDLNSPYAWRWNPVLEAAIGGESLEQVSSRAKKALFDSIRNTMEKFARSGVTISEFLRERHSARNLRKLVNQSCHSQSGRVEGDRRRTSSLRISVGTLARPSP
jgi:hypothetical protein